MCMYVYIYICMYIVLSLVAALAAAANNIYPQLVLFCIYLIYFFIFSFYNLNIILYVSDLLVL